MFTHWSPMRSMCLIMCSRAATSRRSPATGAWQREQREDALVDLEVAAVDAVVVGDHHLGELDVLVLERLEHAVELLDDQVEAAQRVGLELLQLLLEVRAPAPARAALVGRPACRLVPAVAELAGDIFLGPRVVRAW